MPRQDIIAMLLVDRRMLSQCKRLLLEGPTLAIPIENSIVQVLGRQALPETTFLKGTILCQAHIGMIARCMQQLGHM